MKAGSKHIIPVLFFCIVASSVQGQVTIRASVDRDRILIGEPVELTVEAFTPLGSPVGWFDEDSIPHFEVVSRSPLDTVESIDGKKIVQQLVITSFDSGRWQIPPFQVNVAGQPYYSDTSVNISVNYVAYNPADDYRDIKQIIEVASPSLKYVPWILAIASLVFFAAFLWLLHTRKHPARKQRTPPPVITSPYEDAMQALEELSQRQPSEGEEKVYYTDLNDVLRIYLNRKFNISTIEKTNEQLILKIKDLNLPKDNLFKLAQSLKMGDFVKFARYRPEVTDNKINLEVVRVSIEILDNNYISVV